MSSESCSTPTLTITEDDNVTGDVTQKQRSPTENAFYESFLLQSKSDVGNLYASNIYYSQKHAMEMKDLHREKAVYLTDVTKQQKEMIAKMQILQQKQEKITRERRNQKLESLTRAKLRPNSTSLITTNRRSIPKRSELRVRSGSLTFLEPSDFERVSRNLSRSTELLDQMSSLNIPESKTLARSCEDLSTINKMKSSCKVKLPSITKVADENLMKNNKVLQADPTFVTMSAAVTSSPPSKPKFLSPGFDYGQRRGSLDAHLDRRRMQQECRVERQLDSTQTKWVPRGFSGRKNILPSL